MAGQHLEGGARVRGEGARVGTLDVEHAHQPVLVDQRDGQLRHHSREERDVAGVLGDVGDEDGLAEERRRPHDPLPGLDAKTGRDGRVVAFDVGGHEVPVAAGKEDVEDAVVDDPAQLLGDGREELVGIEDGVDLAHQGEQLAEQLAGQGWSRLEAVRGTHEAIVP